MTCTQCNTENAPESAYCKNCGTRLPIVSDYINTGATKAFNLFLAYMGVITFESLLFLILNKVMMADKNYLSDRWKTFQNIETGAGWLCHIAELMILVLLLVHVKQKNAQVWLIIYTVIQFVLFIAWRIMPLFEKSLQF